MQNYLFFKSDFGMFVVIDQVHKSVLFFFTPLSDHFMFSFKDLQWN